jgi:thiol:disulfide interchange protein
MTILGVAAALALGAPALAADGIGPKLRVTKLEQLPTPLPKPYNEGLTPAQVDAQVDAAFARARKSGKNVILDLGGNWCVWCRELAAAMDLPEAKPFIAANFEVVSVNTSSTNGTLDDRNVQILQRFKVKKIDGVPWLIVAAPDGKILASSSDVTDKQHETPQLMINWIAAYTPKKAKS